ncbi:MAG: C-GCAxxG-C-C family (seleno)protein [Candidatus Omnitrophota bacterium]
MMAGKKARKYYLGQGVVRLGCAQSVAESLRESFGLDDAFIKTMSSATGGRAPSGYCGAVYAALRVVEEKDLNKKEEIEAFFKKEAGGVTCREIRSHGRLMCADCVEQAAHLLSNELHGK